VTHVRSRNRDRQMRRIDKNGGVFRAIPGQRGAGHESRTIPFHIAVELGRNSKPVRVMTELKSSSLIYRN